MAASAGAVDAAQQGPGGAEPGSTMTVAALARAFGGSVTPGRSPQVPAPASSVSKVVLVGLNMSGCGLPRHTWIGLPGMRSNAVPGI